MNTHPRLPFPCYPLDGAFIGWQTYGILLTNQTQNDVQIIKQCDWSDVLQVCLHLQVTLVLTCKSVAIYSSRECCRYKLTDIIALSVLSYVAVFVSIFTQSEDKRKELRRRLPPPYHSSCSIKICDRGSFHVDAFQGRKGNVQKA